MAYDILITELGAEFKPRDGSASRTVSHNIDLTNVRGGFKDFNESAFFSCACFSPRDRSASSAKIRRQRTKKPIGWFVPSLYFAEPGEFTDVKFLADFAYAGFRNYWKSPSFKEIRSIYHGDVLPGESSFSDAFPAELGFATFSIESLKQTKIQISSIKISMLRSEVWAFDGKMPIHRFISGAQMAAKSSNATDQEKKHRYPPPSESLQQH